MQKLSISAQRKVNGGAPYTMYTATFMGNSFNWINPTGTFYYQGYFPQENGARPYKYYSPNVTWS